MQPPKNNSKQLLGLAHISKTLAVCRYITPHTGNDKKQLLTLHPISF